MEYTEKLHLNLPGDADPLDVSKLSENFEILDMEVENAGSRTFKAGDILSTYRTDLGENWLLCNGDSFDPEEYPALAAVCPALETGAELISENSLVQNTGGKLLYASNETHIVCYQSETSYLSVIKRSDMSQTVWQLINPGAALLKIAYVNGRWLFFGFTRSYPGTTQSGYTAVVNHIGDDVTFTRTVTNTDIASYLQTNNTKFEYIDGVYYAFYTNYANVGVVYATNPDFSDAAIYAIPKTSVVKASNWNFVRTDEHFVFIGFDGASQYITDILYSTDPTSGYVERNFDTNTQTPITYLFYSSKEPIFCDGKIFLSGYGGINGNAQNTLVLVSLDSPTAEIQYHEAPELRGTIGTDAFTQSTTKIVKIRGRYIVFAGNRIVAFSSDTWETSLIDVSGFSFGAGGNVFPSGEKMLIFESTGDSSSTNRILEFPIFFTPRIDTPQSYTYIKAR